MTRYCAGCASEVEVADGFCLLGHPAAEGRATGTMNDLRNQVDAAFSEASTAVVSMVTAADVAASAGLESSPQVSKAPVSVAPPPPPPSGSVAGGGHRDAFLARPNTGIDARDPIAAFGPPPRMDWGPKRNLLLRLRRAEAG